MSEITATGTFTVDLTPAEAVAPHTGRFDLHKTWVGDIDGTSVGSMFSAGDPATGTAGYVAIESFNGTIAGRRGTLAFQQFGTMLNGATTLTYQVVPGSGTDELTGLTGEVNLDIIDGVHHVALTLQAF